MCWLIYSFVIVLKFLIRVLVSHVFDFFFNNANVFVSSFKQRFTGIFSSDGVFNKDFELLLPE